MEQVLAKCIQPLMACSSEFKVGSEYIFNHDRYQEIIDTPFGIEFQRPKDRYSIAIRLCLIGGTVPFTQYFYDRRTCEENGWLYEDEHGNREPLLCFDDFFQIIPQLNK
jgi:hypothetical protein